MLEYVVTRQLNREGDELKEYTIAVDVLDKPDDFDPQTDSIVMVMLGRVRNAQELYHATDGAADPVHISIPRGGYQPQFGRAGEHMPPITTPPDVASTHTAGGRGKPNRRAMFTALGLVGLGLLAGWTWIEKDQPTPAQISSPQKETRVRLLVQHLQPQPTGNPSALTARLAAGLSGELVSDMLVYPWMNIVQWPDSAEPLSEITRQQDFSSRFHYALSGSVAASDGATSVTVRLQDVPSLKVKWSRTWQHSLSGSGTSIEQFQRRMVSEIAEQLASDKGILPKLVIALKGPERKVDFSGFECFLGMYQYWEVRSAAGHAQLRTCLEQTVKDNPAYADACAALAYICIDEQRYRRNPREGVDAWMKATAAVDRALGLEPTNPLVLGAAMTLAIEKPDRDVAAFHRHGQRALELRPNDGFAMANYGMKRAIYLGEWKEGLELTLTLPGWYLLLPAFDALLRLNDASMIEVTERLPMSHSVAGNMLRAIAAHRAGRKDLLVHHVNILRQDGVNDIPAALSHIRNRRFEPDLQNALETQFSKAFRAARTS